MTNDIDLSPDPDKGELVGFRRCPKCERLFIGYRDTRCDKCRVDSAEQETGSA